MRGVVGPLVTGPEEGPAVRPPGRKQAPSGSCVCYREVVALGVPEDRVLNATKAAAYLDVPRRWLVREGVRKYKVPFLQPPGSRTLLFFVSDLDRTLESWRASDKVGTQPRDRAKSLGRKSHKRTRNRQLSGKG